MSATGASTSHAAAQDLRWTLGGAALPAAVLAVTNILLARALGIEGFGEWIFFTRIGGYAITVLLGTATFTLSYHIPRGDYDGRDLLAATGLVALLVGLGGAAVAAMLAQPSLDAPTAGMTIAGGALAVTLALQFWAFAALDAVLRFGERTRLAVLSAIGGLVAMALLLAAGALSPTTALAVRGVTLAVAAALAWWRARVVLPRAGKHIALAAGARLAVAGSWQVTVGSFIGGGTTAAVLTAIGIFGGAASVGAAGVGGLLAQPIALLSVGLSAVLLPHGAREQTAHTGLRRLGLLVSAGALLYVAAASVAGPWLYHAITGKAPSHAALSIALLLLWGNWFKQLQGVDVIILRADGRLMAGLVVALAGTVPVVVIAWVAALTVTDDLAVATAAGWALAQGVGVATATWAARRDQRTK